MSCYSSLLATYDANNPSDARIIAELLLEITVYLLHEKTLSEDAWEMVSKLCAISVSGYCGHAGTHSTRIFICMCIACFIMMFLPYFILLLLQVPP